MNVLCHPVFPYIAKRHNLSPIRGQAMRHLVAARMVEGEFGACVTCGEDIAAKRLELDPAAAVCITCASGSR